MELIVTQVTAGTGRGGFSRSHRKDLSYAKSHGRMGLQLQHILYISIYYLRLYIHIYIHYIYIHTLYIYTPLRCEDIQPQKDL